MKAQNLFLILFIFTINFSQAQPNWPAIKSNATFIVPDTTYNTPFLQPINVSGWEDGLFMTRDAKHLFSTYLPLDAFSWITDLVLNPICFNFQPYYRPPLLDIDTVTNIFGCPNYMHSDIIISNRADTSLPFNAWTSSNLQTEFSFDGGAHGVLLNADTFDVFVYTKDGPGTQNTDIMFMKNVPVNPNTNNALPILTTTAQEDNPHIERLNDTTLLLLFDRDRYIYYALTYDNGTTWQTPVLISNVINDQAPYDVQPHLWNDGTDWWIYFCSNDNNNKRCIYKSKQLIANDWNSWGTKELVIEPGMITGNYGTIFGVGEPTMSYWGDISFVVVYGNTTLADSTDVFDCDPWFLPKKSSPLTAILNHNITEYFKVFPNPAKDEITITFNDVNSTKEINIFNQLGEVIKQITTHQNTINVNIQDLSKGLYILKYNQQSYTKLVVVK
jgi:hypothetical protein